MMITTQKSNEQQKHTAVNRVLWRVLLLNLLVAAAKIVAGLLTGAISMVADGFHSLTDGASNIIGLVGSAVANRPPDRDHPYGHQKYETFATLAIGLLLLLTSWNILKSVVQRLMEGTAPNVTVYSIGVIVVTIFINIGVTRYERRQGQRFNSDILLADAQHTQSDIFVSLSVLGGLFAALAGWPWLDGVIALAIVGVITHAGWQILKRASDILADSAVLDKTRVKQTALRVAGVEGCHKVRSRGSDQAAYLDLHIQVQNEMTISEAHYVGHVVQDRLQKRFGLKDVIVHVEPLTINHANPPPLPPARAQTFAASESSKKATAKSLPAPTLRPGIQQL